MVDIFPMMTRLVASAPIFPVTNLTRSLEHYRSLGFDVEQYSDDEPYGFAERNGVVLHLSQQLDHDPPVGAGAAYVYVEDADALAQEWSDRASGGITHLPVLTDYGLREGTHVDPDNNLIRFGSHVE